MSDVTRASVNSENAAQIGAQVAARQEAERSATKNTISSRVIGGVARTTLTTTTDAIGASTQRVEKTTSDVTRVNTSDLGDATPGAPVFTSSMGRVLSTSEIKPDSLVKVAGVTTSVRAALHAGLIRESGNGQYVSASGVGASPATTEQKPAEQQQQQQQTPEPTSNIEPLDAEAESVLATVNAKLSHGEATAIASEVISTGDVSEAIAEIAAQKLGATTAQVREQAARVRASFEAQAHRAIGDGAEAVFEWANIHARDDLRGAVNEQVNAGTLTGYKALLNKYYATAAEHSPDAVLANPDFQAAGVRREKDGKITLHFADVGRVEYGVAFRSGLIAKVR